MAERYTVSFTITSQDLAGLTLLREASRVAREWACGRFEGPPVDAPTGEWERDGERLRLRDGLIGEAGFFALEWEHPDREEPQYRWLTELRLATEGDTVEVFVDVQLLDTGPAVRPEGKDVDRPAVVRELIEAFTCNYGGHPLTTKASRVTARIAETFTRDVVLNSNRRLPVVVVSRDGEGACAVDPDSLQSRLAGLATVAVYDEEATWTLTEQLGRPLTCFGGAVRVYWPSCSRDDNPLRHRRWLPEHARELGPRLGRILLNLFVSRFRRYIDQGVYDNVTGRIRRAEQERLLEEVREKAGDVEAAQQLFEEMAQAERHRTELQARLRELQAENELLRAELDQHKVNYRLIGATSQEDSETEEELEVGSVADAVKLATQRLTSLRFLPSATESAAQSPYHQPAQVYEAFETLDELAKERRRGPLGRSIEDWLGERGVPYSPHESQTTMGKWGHERQFRDGDRTLTIEEHIKFGADGDPQYHIRIYVAWDEAAQSWIVGHVGRHLTTTQS